MMRRIVDLPQPEGPSRMQNSPSATSKETFLRISLSPKRFVSCRTVNDAMARPPFNP